MADNKQYITQVQDNGRVMISESVISTIVFQALNDIEGYVGLSAKAGSDIVELLGLEPHKAVILSVAREDMVDGIMNCLGYISETDEEKLSELRLKAFVLEILASFEAAANNSFIGSCHRMIFELGG